MASTTHDASAEVRQAVAAALQESDERYHLLVDHLPEAILVHVSGRLVFVNPAAVRLHGATSAADLLGRSVLDLVHPDDRELLAARLGALSDDGTPAMREQRIVALDGNVVESESLALPVTFDGESATLVVVRDLTERKAAEAALTHAALHDSLTGLPNRALVRDRLSQMLASAQRSGATVAVLFIDIDRFKLVNDSLGHERGDELLVTLARRIDRVLRLSDTVGRYGGDEFVVVAEIQGEGEVAVGLAERISDVVAAPIDLDDDEVIATCSIGIAVAHSGRGEVDQLISDADAAMYRAKRRGSSGVELFDEQMRTMATTRLHVEHDLRQALEHGDFEVYYQPLVTLPGAELVGVEALLRWHHPERGLVEPIDFIEIAEDTGLIVPIGSWVLTEACRQAIQWQKLPGAGQLEVAVNLSAAQLNAGELLKMVEAVLAESKFEPGRLSLSFEITESVVMHDPDGVAETLSALRAMGLGLSIDDFGTGYSSLAYLKRFPVDTLKIDRSFVAGIGVDDHDEAIVESVINLAHVLGLRAVAEGVETPEQAKRLHELGCDRAQGYFFGRPAPADRVTSRLTGGTWT